MIYSPIDINIDDRWILSKRGSKNDVDPMVPYAWLHEKEYVLPAGVEDVNTIFLTNRECPYHCLMCDLWKNTTDKTIPEGAIPAQIRYALERLPDAKHLKLYNSGNFFDPGAIPTADFEAIAEIVAPFESLIVESHPRRLGNTCLDFSRMTRPRLQVAMGLETVHPEVLPKLNKRMTLDDFKKAVEFLGANGIQSRAFILLKPPFLNEKQGVEWAKRSIDFAFLCGVDACTVIPTRSGNGALEILKEKGLFFPPKIKSLEEVLDYGIGLGRGPVFADLWDLEQFSTCSLCFGSRQDRINRMNLEQDFIPLISCIC